MGIRSSTRAFLCAALVVTACTGDDDGPGADSAGPSSARTSAASNAPATTPAGTSETIGSSVTTGASAVTTAATGDEPEPLRYEATIRRTTDGVAHVTGESLADAAFGQGYANAEDHACTLADQVLRVQGRRAATFGPGEDGSNVDSDFAWLAIGIDELARHDFERAPAEVVELFEAFAAGWSRHVDDAGVDGLSGWCAGEAWVEPLTGADVYSYARSISLLASGGAITDFIAPATPPDAARRAEPAGLAAAASSWLSADRGGLGSNGWAVGADKVMGGRGGLLVANPHFPWEGERRFWEVHLTVPGELDIYGVQLIGVPGVGIGFTDSFAWTHTVSAGHRFTAYTLDLAPGDPTAYLVDGERRQMTSRRHTIEVRRRGGETRRVSRTMWSSEYGPIIDFPGFGWTEEATITYRDANIGNDEFAEQYLAFTTATSFDEFVDAHRRIQGVPLFNTIAVSDDGRAWYADTSATPNLSAEAERRYLRQVERDPITAIAADNGAILLDGSDSRFAWEEVPGARDPGLVPFDELPTVERSDYVFNANDSFWMPHATAMLEGDYSVLHGEQRTERSLRTRENAFVLSETGEGTPAGADGRFTGEELRDASVENVAGSARLLRQAVADRCTPGAVDVPELPAASEVEPGLPAASVDLSEPCAQLDAWDGRYDLDSRGAVLWREVLSAIRRDVPDGLDALWDRPFDAERPMRTPSGLASAPEVEAAVRQAIARAVQTLDQAGVPLDAPLGDVQYSLRSRPRIGLHGGPGGDGLTNAIDYDDPSATSEPVPEAGEPVVAGSDLRRGGYPVDYGTSWLMTVDFTGPDPQAWVVLTYGQTGDRDSPLFDVQTRRFSEQDWRVAAFTEDAIAADPDLTEQTVSGD